MCLRSHALLWIVFIPFPGTAVAQQIAKATPPGGYPSRADTPSQKVVVATCVADITGSVAARLTTVTGLVGVAAREAGKQYAGHGLDLMVFPEFAIRLESGKTAEAQAVSLDGSVGATLGAKAREVHAWLIVPMTLRERDRISNAAVLFNRTGEVAGIFRKVHPVADDNGVLEDGVAPGGDYPVFGCDFGKLGILICWDMGYEEGWDTLAARGTRLVALPSASPQTIRPAAEALRHRYYVVSSTPKNNASIFDPIGRVIAQTTDVPGIIVKQIDLSFAVLHWSEKLQEGRALTERFGDKVGYDYSSREDTGVFWSNDPGVSIGAMIRDLGLREMDPEMERMENAARLLRRE